MARRPLGETDGNRVKKTLTTTATKKAETRRAAASNNELEILLLESEDELCENGESNTSTVAQTTSDKSLDRRNGRERRQSQKQTENATNLP